MNKGVLMRTVPSWLTLTCGLALTLPAQAGSSDAVPNILVILADDLGYADVGFNGCRDIPTPSLDGLALRGVKCMSGYVTHPFCSPTRAGLLTGRYQQRFGHENNPAWLPDDPKAGLPASETTLPQVLQAAGYVTGCVGKWHLGAHPSLHPNRRGFDEYFGLLGGGHVYVPGEKGGVEYTIPLDRNGQKEELKAYLTDALGKEASAFISRNKAKPWFLYLAFNSPHTPLTAKDEYVARVDPIEDATRRKYAAMVVALDEAIGGVLETLQNEGLEETTLVWFLSDNGGPTAVTRADNKPFRGAKGQLFEGGVRVPFVVSWPGHLPHGRNEERPVHSLDVFATAVAVSRAQVPPSHKPEGVNLIPYLSGEDDGPPHERIFWRHSGGSWAVREGVWKLVSLPGSQPQLFNLHADVGETVDVASDHPKVVGRLQTAFDEWNQHNIAPVFENPRPANNPRKRPANP
jgi:arylsulfatase A-like enzyme